MDHLATYSPGLGLGLWTTPKESSPPSSPGKTPSWVVLKNMGPFFGYESYYGT